nr:unnamed protein product [Digitaria exilis]
MPRGQQSLVTWATPRLTEDKVKQCVDPRLMGEYLAKGLAKLAAVAALCVQYEAEFRPNMSIVVKALSPLIIHPLQYLLGCKYNRNNCLDNTQYGSIHLSDFDN